MHALLFKALVFTGSVTVWTKEGHTDLTSTEHDMFPFLESVGVAKAKFIIPSYFDILNMIYLVLRCSNSKAANVKSMIYILVHMIYVN